jgi:hypothetical protein
VIRKSRTGDNGGASQRLLLRNDESRQRHLASVRQEVETVTKVLRETSPRNYGIPAAR